MCIICSISFEFRSKKETLCTRLRVDFDLSKFNREKSKEKRCCMLLCIIYL